MAMNMGSADHILRVLTGTAGGEVPGLISTIGYVGVLPLLAGLVGYCPAYRLLGRRT